MKSEDGYGLTKPSHILVSFVLAEEKKRKWASLLSASPPLVMFLAWASVSIYPLGASLEATASCQLRPVLVHEIPGWLSP